MDNFDIVGALRDYANANNWGFLYGNDEHRNYEATKQWDDDQIILGSSTFLVDYPGTNSRLNNIIYSGDLYLGRKRETAGTVASLDETHLQKWDRRLQELSSLLASTVLAFACEHDLDYSGTSMRLEINRHDTNIDFVATLVTFTQIPNQ